MKPKQLLFAALLGCCASTSVVAQSALDYPSVWQCDTAKANWYCDEDERQNPTSRPAPTPAAERDRAQRLRSADIKTAEQMRQELKRREDLAVMQPTEANVKSYLELWQVTQDRAAEFTDAWRRVVWQNPALDYSLRRPANNTAIKTFDSQRDASEEQHLKSLAAQHGLIFFYRSDCPYCHAMAPMLRLLTEKYGIEVLAVSVDGAPLLPEYPTFTDGRAQAAAWGIERVPALFIGAKDTGDHAPIGFGQMSLSEIVNRIFVLTNTKPGENF